MANFQNPIFLIKIINIGRPEHSLTTPPPPPASDNISFCLAPPYLPPPTPLKVDIICVSPLSAKLREWVASFLNGNSETDTAKNTVISPNFLVWKYCGKVQSPHSFGRIACAFSQNLHIRKLGEVTVYFAVW